MVGDDGDVVGCVLDGESRETLGVKREKRIDFWSAVAPPSVQCFTVVSRKKAKEKLNGNGIQNKCFG